MVTSHHEFGSHSYSPKQSSDRSFGLIVGTILVGLSVSNLWHGGSRWRYYAAAGCTLLVVAWLRPKLLGSLNRLWTQFGLVLGKITHPIVMGVLFFLVVTPLALIARAVGKDFLGLRSDPSAGTYWISRHSHVPTPESLRDQF